MAETATLVECAPQRRGIAAAPRFTFDGLAGGSCFRFETFKAREHEFILALAGEFDLSAGPELRSELAALRLRQARRIIVDLSETRFIDASTLGLLMGTAEWLHSAGGELVLVCVDRHLLKVLELTGLDRRLHVYRSRAQALAALPPVSLRASA